MAWRKRDHAERAEALGYYDMLPDLKTELAASHLFDDKPRGVGHAWYRKKFVVPFQAGAETETRFIPARVGDNAFNNPEYRRVLECLSGAQRRAWLDGDWDLAPGQHFTAFSREIDVLGDFDETRAVEWWAAMDYGFAHCTVCLLARSGGDGNTFVVGRAR